ncbi:MAG: ATP-binding cassette domain-containing protein [Candidatus Edwardsbacteria bacterium]
MSLVRVRSLCKYFKTFNRKEGLWGAVQNLFVRDYTLVKAVDNISFQIERGEIVGYIGPNGAGKSTTIKMLTGILVPTSGEIFVGGLVPWKNRYEHVKKIGVVFGQRTQLWWDIAVFEGLKLLQKIYEVPQKDFEERLKKFDEILGISEFLSVPVRKLSLGQRMRCDLVASLLHNPALVFLDEPTIGLDIAVKSKIRQFIKNINQEFDTTIILATHDLNDIEELCARIIIIDKGKILYDGKIGGLKDKVGGKCRIFFEFNYPLKVQEVLSVIDSRRVEVKEIDPFKIECSFNKKLVSSSRLIEKVLLKFSVRDLTLEEPAIEEVVKQIYAGSS